MSEICYALTHRKRDESLIVEDADGVALAYVYFENEPTRRWLMKLLSSEDTKTVAQMIVRTLTEAPQICPRNR